MKNPLRKRLKRELRSDFGKYLVIFLLMVLSIAEISGFLVADESMITAYNESFEKYNVEDGNFTSEKKLKDRQINAIEDLGVTLYPLYSTDRPMNNGTTLRFFAMREEIDRACLMEGAFPEGAGEIAIDRMYADNNGLKVGDRLAFADVSGTAAADLQAASAVQPATAVQSASAVQPATAVQSASAGQTPSAAQEPAFTITGLVALSDYSTMFENNNDTMFDAKQFGVCVVSQEVFDTFDRDILTWRYAWKYNDPPADKDAENELSEEFLKELSGIVNLSGYIPRYQNQAIVFTGDDMGSDRVMMTIFLYIMIIILAFVFAVTISNTIVKESAVIGTLRATGYTKQELIRHYMTLPLVITLISAAVGNILGYTVLKQFNANLYYGSYSLPTYVTMWNADAFLETTVVPLVLMILINWWILQKRLKLKPLQFLRRDLHKKSSRGAVPLSRHIPFFSRFRLRIFIQNISNYLVLAVGILFANFLLLFGLMLPNVLDNYMKALPDNMFCNYQYVLQMPAGAVNEDRKIESLVTMLLFQNAVETENEDAEKFGVWQLRTCNTDSSIPVYEEDILVYGIEKNSRYIDLDFEKSDETSPGPVYISRAYAQKWMLSPGDSITLKEPYGDKKYTFRVSGIYPYDGAISVFMEREALNEQFDLGEGTFSGYFSDTEITDIDEKYIGQMIDFEALSKVSRQLTISMGGMMKLVDIFAVIMFIVMIYLMSKIIIEKNAMSISMTKILGYRNGEIGRLYILVTTLLVIAMMAASIPLESAALQWIVAMALRMEMSGWIPFLISNDVYIKMMLYGVITYAVVAVLEYWKISRVPMDEALKNVE